MRKIKKLYKKFLRPIIDIRPHHISAYIRYFKQLRTYRRLSGVAPELWPILGEDTPTTSIDPHYFYQSIWTARQIARARPVKHVDIGSQTNMVGLLTAIVPVTFVDLRPLDVTIDDLTIARGSVLDMPFADQSVVSLSCLHVAEHIGLGRYGDPLNPNGTQKACAELARVLAPGGSLYFSLPIGRERTEFNAHRVHHPETILAYFTDLTLEEFSAVTDRGEFVRNAGIKDFDNARYACGLFRFTRPEKKA